MTSRVAYALLALAAFAAVTHGAEPCTPLKDYLAFYKQYSLMSAAFSAIPSLEVFASLSSPPAEPFTVLLPNDNTIRNFLPVLNITVEDLVQDAALLEAIVRTHIVMGAIPADIADGAVLGTTLATQQLTVTRADEDICFNAWSFACINGKQNPICQGNAVQVNSVIIPDSLDGDEGLTSTAIAG